MSRFQERRQAISNGSHALVIDGGIAGLSATGILLNHSEHITVVELNLLILLNSCYEPPGLQL